MKNNLLALFCILLAGATVSLAQPKLKIVEGDTYNWKEVKPKDNPLKATIHFTNIGDQTLEIKEVKPTCGCTTAPLDKYTLAPRDTAKLDVTFNVGTRSGKVHKTIRISSNDPASPMKVLGLEAEVFNAIEVLPAQYFSFSNMQIGAEAVATVKIANKTNKDITLSDIVVNPEIVSLNIKNRVVVKANSEIEVIAKVKPVKAGYFNCSVKMKSNHPDYSEVVITGYGNVTESPVFNNR